jgi:hypothetical protein
MDDLVSTAEAAALMRRSPATLRHWRLIGAGPAFLRLARAGRHSVLYRRADLAAWIAAREVRP